MSVRFKKGGYQRLDFGTVPQVQHVQQKSWSFWFKPITFDSSVPNTQDIAKLQESTILVDESWNIAMSAGSSFFNLFYAWTGSVGVWYCSGQTLSVGNLYHIVITYDYGSVNNNPLMYVNGVNKAATRSNVPSGSIPAGNNNTMLVGAGQDGNKNNEYSVDGNVQDFRIYNRILSQSDVTYLYTAGRPIDGLDNGLIFHAPMLYASGINAIPFSGILSGSNKFIERMNCYQGTPFPGTTELDGSSDLVYGSSF